MTQPVRPYIGGQAVIEGVMMRAPTSIAVALRRRDGTITVRERAMTDTREGWQKLPFLRGIASLVESLRIGNEALKFSSDKLQEDWQDDAGSGGSAAGPFASVGLSLWMLMTQDELPAPAPAAEKGKSGMVLMLVIMVGVMFALPQALASGVLRIANLDLPVQSAGNQAITGFFKLAIVLGYMLAIRRIGLIRRVFQYHGAEHKTISTYEAEEPLDVEHARKKTTRHPRCGTTFLVLSLIHI